jgi:hypothetical protein
MDVLRSLSITVEEMPTYDHHPSVIDEQLLAEQLAAETPYRRRAALDNDVASISAIMRLRRGQTSYGLEDCRFLFVTTNRPLVRVASQFSSPRGRQSDIVPAALTADVLTTVCWLKLPAKFPELPRERVLADAYAVLNPDEKLWQAWSERVDALQADGEVEPDTADMLRYAYASRRALMDATLGRPGNLESPLVVSEVVERAKAEITADLRAAVAESEERLNQRVDALTRAHDSAMEAATAAQDQLEQAQLAAAGARAESEAERIARRALRKINAQRFGSASAWVFVGFPVAVIAVAAIIYGVSGDGAVPWAPSALLVASAAIVTIVTSFTGWSVFSIQRWAARKSSEWWDRRLATLGGETDFD